MKKIDLEDYSGAELVGIIIGVLIAIPLVLALDGWIVMTCWNAVIPAVFGLPTLTFAQGVWLWALCAMLFSGFGGGD